MIAILDRLIQKEKEEFWLVFSPQKINALNKLGTPLFGANRPDAVLDAIVGNVKRRWAGGISTTSVSPRRNVPIDQVPVRAWRWAIHVTTGRIPIL